MIWWTVVVSLYFRKRVVRGATEVVLEGARRTVEAAIGLTVEDDERRCAVAAVLLLLAVVRVLLYASTSALVASRFGPDRGWSDEKSKDLTPPPATTLDDDCVLLPPFGGVDDDPRC